MARFLDGTFARIDTVLSSDEDRASFIRNAVESEIARRNRGLLFRPQAPSPVGEAELDFCLNAVRHAVQDRKAALAGKGVERAAPANAAQGPQPGKRLGRKPIRRNEKDDLERRLGKWSPKSLASFPIAGGFCQVSSSFVTSLQSLAWGRSGSAARAKAPVQVPPLPLLIGKIRRDEITSPETVK